MVYKIPYNGGIHFFSDLFACETVIDYLGRIIYLLEIKRRAFKKLFN